MPAVWHAICCARHGMRLAHVRLACGLLRSLGTHPASLWLARILLVFAWHGCCFTHLARILLALARSMPGCWFGCT